MKLLGVVTASFVSLLLAIPISAQSMQWPDRALVDQAKAIVADSVFTRLADRKADELAEWIVDQVHSDVSGSTRNQLVNQFQSQFRMVVQDEPESPFGEMDGYDLLQEMPLPGTRRYFRLTYITYHQRSALIWEFHFYVRPDGNLSLVFFNFSGQNPFEYMTTGDMLIQQFYDPY